MTPDHYGYHPCVRCGVQRPVTELISDELSSDDGEKAGATFYACADSALCSRLAGVGAVSEGEVLAAMGEPTPLELVLTEVTR